MTSGLEKTSLGSILLPSAHMALLIAGKLIPTKNTVADALGGLSISHTLCHSLTSNCWQLQFFVSEVLWA